jgi:hypothetical protein
MPCGHFKSMMDLGARHDPSSLDILNAEPGPVQDPFRGFPDGRKMAWEHVQEGRPGGSA